MVFVNDRKYACESCIKGHRSSSCGHTDRPLFEVKKKGRPVSQCDKCRELRKTKRVHSKCDCSIEKLDKSSMKQLAGKSKRYIPILPALPNGLKDTYHPKNDNPIPADPKSQVDNLLNPCHCKDIYNCKCRNTNASGSSGLDALASAAALCCSSENSAPQVSSSQLLTPQEGASCCGSSPSSIPSKRRRRRSSASAHDHDRSKRGLSLAPILLPEPFETPPVFPSIPPLSTIASIAGTGCCCGFDCTCPGCVEHRGSEHASKADGDCPECGHCIDHTHGIEFPPSTGYGSSLPSASAAPTPTSTATPSFIDAFFARAAAAIPPPPSQRAAFSALSFDPQDVTVYPPALFAGAGARLDAHGPAFGLVRLPKLECCAGSCGCPGDGCGCGTDCNGCCSVHEPGRDGVVQQEAGAGAAGPSSEDGCCAVTQ